jgi:hypothetical protein
LYCASNISGESPLSIIEYYSQPPGKCQNHGEDKYRYEQKVIGSARFGFPLIETRKVRDKSDRTSISNYEVTEISTNNLDSALFEAPADYTEIKDVNEYRQIVRGSKTVNKTDN